MNNIIKIGLMPLLVFTVIAIGLFGISIATYSRRCFRRKKRRTVILKENTATISVKDITEKCSNWIQCNWDPGC